MTQLSIPVDDPVPFSAAALSLSFGGVEFALTPSNKDAVVSYRNDGRGVILTLTNFTGTFQVVQKETSMPFPVSSYTSKAAPNNKVEEEEPNSPETMIHNNQKETSPGQQKLTFGNKNKNSSKIPAVKTKNPIPKAARKKVKPICDRNSNSNNNHTPMTTKKSIDMSHTSTTPKACPNINNNKTTEPAALTLGQTMPDPSQMDSTQNATTNTDNNTPDVSQTMDTSPSANDTACSSKQPTEMCRIPSTSNNTVTVLADKPKTSVQEILDRVNNSDESVATLKDYDDNSITSIKSVESEKTSHFQVVDQGGPDPMDTTSNKDNNNNGPGDAKQEPPSTTCVAPTTTPAAPEQPSFQGYPPPCPRWGHTMTKIKDDRMLVYGGQSFDLDTGNPIILSDVHVYNTAKRTWDKPINCKGEARQWHSATFLPERELLLTFGGESMDHANNKSKKDKVVTTDMLRVLDTDIMLWYPPAVSGEVPTGRSGHTATWMPNTNEVVLFGGCIKGKKWLHSVSVLDTVRWIWSTPTIQGVAPKSRSYHSSTAVQKIKSASSADSINNNNNASSSTSSYKLVIFGGNNQTSCFNTLHVLEQDDGGVWRWSNPKPTGQAPFPRTGHSATLLEDGKTICIYGGWDPNEEAATTIGNDQHQENIFKASYLLDTEHMSWRVGPKAVYDCGSNSGNGDHTTQAEDCGAKRCGHTAGLHPESGEVLAFGGQVPGERLAGDFYKLSPAERLVGLG
jgi:hypothetical protein